MSLMSPDGRFVEAFSAYAQHQQSIEDFINALAATDDPNDEWVQRRLAIDLNINLDRLSASEIKYIEEETAKRYGHS